MKNKKLILIGDSLFAQIAYEYFTHDSEYEVVAFAVERQYIKQKSLFEVPITAFEDLEKEFSAQEHYFYCAIPYNQLNRLRTRLYLSAKEKGYKPASYISSRAFVWRNTKLGEHLFIFEDNTIQPFVEIKDNVVLWSGNHIGHHSKIGKHTFISSHVVISGNVDIGESCFFGVNSTIINNLKISDDTLVGAGALVTRDTKEGNMIKGTSGQVGSTTSWDYFELPNSRAREGA
ncbi:MAG: putative transferase [Bacteriovoracaceae bacterium]|nr:putative transferase [Bacteriovoracaceae bacterium]